MEGGNLSEKDIKDKIGRMLSEGSLDGDVQNFLNMLSEDPESYADMMNKIITISEHAKYGFLNSEYDGVNKQTGQHVTLKCNTPIDVVHYPVKSHEKKSIELDLTG